jgi:hypothetical protein
VKITPLIKILLSFAFIALPCRAASSAPVQSLGNNTFSITREASNGFARDTDKLKAEALDEAAAYCANLHKELKVISATTSKPRVMLTGYAKAKVVFKALDAQDPELRAPVAAETSAMTAPSMASSSMAAGTPAPATESAPARSSTDALYSDLTKLDELRKRGILTDDEFQAQKKKVLDRSN